MKQTPNNFGNAVTSGWVVDRPDLHPWKGAQFEPKFRTLMNPKLVFPKNFAPEMNRFRTNPAKKTKNQMRGDQM
jgi:hypothetical protein